MGFDHLEEFDREQVGNVSSVMKGSIHNDRVEGFTRVIAQPAPAVVDYQVEFFIRQNRTHAGLVAYYLDVAGVDVDDRQALDVGVAEHHLCPGTGSQSNHQDLPGCLVVQYERVGANDDVGVVDEAGIELAVITAVAFYSTIRHHGDDPVPIFDNAAVPGPVLVYCLEIQRMQYIGR